MDKNDRRFLPCKGVGREIYVRGDIREKYRDEVNKRDREEDERGMKA